jgi:GGDEF domain-containing protein
MPSFLCRYGGDEFIIIIHPVEIEETKQLIAEIQDEIDRNEGKFPLSISAGYDTLGTVDNSAHW